MTMMPFRVLIPLENTKEVGERFVIETECENVYVFDKEEDEETFITIGNKRLTPQTHAYYRPDDGEIHCAEVEEVGLLVQKKYPASIIVAIYG